MVALLVVLIAFLLVFIIFQASKASDLLGAIRGEEKDEEGGYQLNAILMMVILVVGFAAIGWSVWYYAGRFLPVSASEHGVWIDSMFNVTLFFTGIVFIGTQIVLFWFAYKYRYKKGRKVFYFPHNNTLEAAWTIIPSIVMVYLVVVGLQNWYKIFDEPPADARVIEMTAQQFQWTCRYSGEDNQLGVKDWKWINHEKYADAGNNIGVDYDDPASKDDFFSTEIHMEVNKPVIFKLGSRDVLHSFFLPHFRVKMDCVPGIPTQFSFTPTITTDSMKLIEENPEFEYELACAELCGSSHYRMRMKVVVEEKEDYEKWLKEQKSYYETVVAPAWGIKIEDEVEKVAGEDPESVRDEKSKMVSSIENQNLLNYGN